MDFAADVGYRNIWDTEMLDRKIAEKATLTVVANCYDGDFKAQLVKDIKALSAGDVVTITGYFFNAYGEYVVVEKDGEVFDVNAKNLLFGNGIDYKHKGKAK